MTVNARVAANIIEVFIERRLDAISDSLGSDVRVDVKFRARPTATPELEPDESDDPTPPDDTNSSRSSREINVAVKSSRHVQSESQDTSIGNEEESISNSDITEEKTSFGEYFQNMLSEGSAKIFGSSHSQSRTGAQEANEGDYLDEVTAVGTVKNCVAYKNCIVQLIISSQIALLNKSIIRRAMNRLRKQKEFKDIFVKNKFKKRFRIKKLTRLKYRVNIEFQEEFLLYSPVLKPRS